MKIKRINLYLVATILTLSVSSFLAAYGLIDEILDSSISLSLNSTTGDLLEGYQTELKKLRELDPDNANRYRKQFFEVQDALFIFKDPNHLSNLVKDSYITYFLILFLVILTVSIIAAFLLSWKVSRSYTSLVRSDLEKSKRLQDLEYFDNWQNIASSLAHEIKNPLTPIEMMISNLNGSFHNLNKDKFEQQLVTTNKVILEEVNRLKNMVNHFSRFSKLPTPELKPEPIYSYFKSLFSGFDISWPKVKFTLDAEPQFHATLVSIDVFLIKQCFLNLVQNAIEANQTNKSLAISLTISSHDSNHLKLSLFNNGTPIDSKNSKRLFQFGYSTKQSSNNQGIGLSVVKKILLDHGGNITHLPTEEGVLFEINMPIYVKS